MAAIDPITKVLIADDEDDILEVIGEYLKVRGFEVWTASDGIDALEIVRAGQVDLVLTDLKMPTMGGIELLSEIRRLDQPVPTIVMTAFGSVETATRAMKEGAHDYLLKPFKLRDVHSAIVRANEMVRLEREDQRMREVLAFYELAHKILRPEEVPRIYGVLAGAARLETDSDEVALWMVGPGGWEAVARGGVVQHLGAVNPDELARGERCEGVLSVAICCGGKAVGVMAVAGGEAGNSEHTGRLETFARVVGETLDRVQWRTHLDAGRAGPSASI